MYIIRNAKDYYPDFHNVSDNLYKSIIVENVSYLTNVVIQNKSFIGYIDNLPLARVALFETENICYFGYIEFTNDYKLFELLMDTVLQNTDKTIVGPVQNYKTQILENIEEDPNTLIKELNIPDYYHSFYEKYGLKVKSKIVKYDLDLYAYRQSPINLEYKDCYLKKINEGIIFKPLSIFNLNKYIKGVSKLHTDFQELEYIENDTSMKEFFVEEYAVFFNKKSYIALKDGELVGAILVKSNISNRSRKKKYSIEQIIVSDDYPMVKKSLLFIALNNIKNSTVKYNEIIEKDENIYFSDKMKKNPSYYYLYEK